MSADTDDDIKADFLTEAGELMGRLSEQLVELEQRPADRDLLNAVFRGFHTIKGGAGFLHLEPVVTLCHAAEDLFNLLRNGSLAVEPSLMDAVLEALDRLQEMLVAVGADQAPEAAPPALIERLHQFARRGQSAGAAPAAAVAAAAAPAADKAGGDVISDDEFEALLDQYHGVGKAPSTETVQRAVTEAKAAAEAPPAPPPAAHVPAVAETSVRVDTGALDGMMNLVGELVLARNRLKTLSARSGQETFVRAVGELDHITRGLQAAVMRVRMQPIRKVFARFPRLARELARGLGKQVEVKLVGEDTGLDKNLVEALADPLVHMVRNSVDHGIEMPERRLAVGKPACGRIRLAAQQTGDNILITVSDDGAGMDPESLRRKAVEKGLLTATDAAQMSVQECLQLIFLPGFSTKEQISDLSGRGVGMDVVKSSITGLGGAVLIDSRPGFGTQIQIRVPLTLAILPALMIGVGERILALPLAPVLDVFMLDPTRVRKLDRWSVLLYRNETLRLVHLHRWLDVPHGIDQPRHVVVVQVDAEHYGFVVTQVFGREEVVIKPLGALLRGLAGLSGATVTGSGRVALILDPPGLVRAAGGGE
ncbi:MAG: chemotaxis protein CheA [Nevskia sp.]|nr:chemotaxis protein CheA [Nevskia sp.]